MLCLTTSNVVEKLVYAQDGILARPIKEGVVLIDFERTIQSSISNSKDRCWETLQRKGAGMVECLPLGRTLKKLTQKEV